MGKRIEITDDLLKEIAFLKAAAEKATAGRPDGAKGFALTAPGPLVLAFPLEAHQIAVARKVGIHVTNQGMYFPFRDVSEAKTAAAQLVMLQEELARVGLAAGWEIAPPPQPAPDTSQSTAGTK